MLDHHEMMLEHHEMMFHNPEMMLEWDNWICLLIQSNSKNFDCKNLIWKIQFGCKLKFCNFSRTANGQKFKSIIHTER